MGLSPKSTSLIAVLLFLSPGSLSSADPAEPQAPRDNPPIATWIQQLDSDQFITRELATEQLLATGAAAVKPLASELIDANRELLSRGTYILRQLALSEDQKTSISAQAGLRNVAQFGNKQAQRQARATLARLSEIRHNRAVSELQRLGARTGTQHVQVGQVIIRDLFTVELDEQWRGNAVDLRRLRWLQDLKCVKFSGEKIDDEHVRQLGDLEQLSIVVLKKANISDWALQHLSAQKNLQHIAIMYCPIGDKSLDHLKVHQRLVLLKLFGTEITAAGASQLRKEMARTQIDHRAGAFLGIGCDPNGTECSITIVQPDSAAEKADLRTGDVILKYNGKAAANFDSLTKLIGENRPGETAKIEIRRERETLVKEVKLGEWE